jgi:hypothetical protein
MILFAVTLRSGRAIFMVVNIKDSVISNLKEHVACMLCACTSSDCILHIIIHDTKSIFLMTPPPPPPPPPGRYGEEERVPYTVLS